MTSLSLKRHYVQNLVWVTLVKPQRFCCSKAIGSLNSCQVSAGSINRSFHLAEPVRLSSAQGRGDPVAGQERRGFGMAGKSNQDSEVVYGVRECCQSSPVSRGSFQWQPHCSLGLQEGSGGATQRKGKKEQLRAGLVQKLCYDTFLIIALIARHMHKKEQSHSS